jgi:hypothetical protein
VGAEVSQVVKAKMRENANTWSKLLGVSGGALELTKCSYHIVTWKFSSSGAPVLSTDRAEFGGVTVSGGYGHGRRTRITVFVSV